MAIEFQRAVWQAGFSSPWQIGKVRSKVGFNPLVDRAAVLAEQAGLFHGAVDEDSGDLKQVIRFWIIQIGNRLTGTGEQQIRVST